jgi:hypothetical protein
MVHTNLRSRAGAVVAGTVVLAALGGVGGAAAAGKIGSLQIRDHSIKAVDYNKGSVDSRALKDGSIAKADLDATLRSLLGVPGAKGDTGEAGADGKDGVSGYHRVVKTTDGLAGRGAHTVTAACDAGEVVIGGGVLGSVPIHVRASYPSTDTVWTATVERVTSSGGYSADVFAVCAVANN